MPLPVPLGFCDHRRMADSRDRSALRTLVGEVVGRLGSLTHRELNPAFEQLGMPPVPDDAGSKRERIELSLGQVPDAELPQVTRRILEHSPARVSPSRRYQLEDLLWAEDAPPEIPNGLPRDCSAAASHPGQILKTDVTPCPELANSIPQGAAPFACPRGAQRSPGGEAVGTAADLSVAGPVWDAEGQARQGGRRCIRNLWREPLWNQQYSS
jgi:hypothetical protein